MQNCVITSKILLDSRSERLVGKVGSDAGICGDMTIVYIRVYSVLLKLTIWNKFWAVNLPSIS